MYISTHIIQNLSFSIWPCNPSVLLPMAALHPFLQLNNILSCVYVPYLLDPSFCWWKLVCFHTLTIVNNDAVDIGVHVSVQISALGFCFLDIYLGMELPGHMVVLFLGFREASILFSTMAASIHSPTNSVRGFPFLHILSGVCCL